MCGNTSQEEYFVEFYYTFPDFASEGLKSGILALTSIPWPSALTREV